MPVIVRVDRLGRIVIPKALRAQLGIGASTELEIAVDGTALRLEPRRDRPRGIHQLDGLPVLTRVAGIVLTDDDVRRLRDDLQR